MTTQSKKPLHFSFDYNIALKYGSDEAIMIKNFLFWIKKNRERKINWHDARTWTFNSIKTFASVFAFWTKKQIRRIINSLIAQGVLITGNYNKTAYDRTYWYAFQDEDYWLGLSADTTQPIDSSQPIENNDVSSRATQNARSGNSKLPIGQMELPERDDLYQITTDKKQILKNNNNAPIENQTICEPIVVVSEEIVSPTIPHSEPIKPAIIETVSTPQATESFQPVPDLTVLECFNDQEKRLAISQLNRVTSITAQAVILFTLKTTIANNKVKDTPIALLRGLVNLAIEGLLTTKAPLAKMKQIDEASRPKPVIPQLSAEERKAKEQAIRVAQLKELVAKQPESVAEVKQKGAFYFGNRGVFFREDFERAGFDVARDD